MRNEGYAQTAWQCITTGGAEDTGEGIRGVAG
jgi:hypothetical protein